MNVLKGNALRFLVPSGRTSIVRCSPIWRLPEPHQTGVFMEISWCRCHWVNRGWLTQSPVLLPFPEDRGWGWKFQLSNDASVFLASSPHQKLLSSSQPLSSHYHTKDTHHSRSQGFQEPCQKPGDQDQIFISIIPQSPSLPSSQSYGFSSRNVQMRELDHKEGWVPKNWCFQTVVLEKTLESPLDCKEITPVNPKEN